MISGVICDPKLCNRMCIRRLFNHTEDTWRIGIVPHVNDSNEVVRHGRITKRGDKLARTTLVQCTLVAKRYSPYLRAYYDRLKKKRGSGKAIIATARKFLGIIYKTLKNGWIFEDFPNFVIANV